MLLKQDSKLKLQRVIVGLVLLMSSLIVVIGVKKNMTQLGQAPESAENASFLHKDSTLKIVQTGTAIIPASGISIGNTTNDLTFGSVTVTHNLGYTPIVLAYLEYGSIHYPLAELPSNYIFYFDSTQLLTYQYVTNVNSSTMTFTRQISIIGLSDSSANGGATFNAATVRYYIFANAAI